MTYSEREPRESSFVTLQTIIAHDACLAERKGSFKILKIAKIAKRVFLESIIFLKDIFTFLLGQTVNQKTIHVFLIFQSNL